MFCPNCGSPDQSAETYCRACGEFLAPSNTGRRIAFGGTTPQENLTAINVLSLIAAIASLIVGILMYATVFSVPIVLFLGAAVLLCNAAWHASNFYIGMKLKNRLKSANETAPEDAGIIRGAETRELLRSGSLDDVIPISVTENTTARLPEKLKRPSS